MPKDGQVWLERIKGIKLFEVTISEFELHNTPIHYHFHLLEYAQLNKN